jgi:D-mannonate dehydratase
MIKAAGMTCTVVESLPVSDDIKRQTGDLKKHIANYKEIFENAAACGLKVIKYNFMPVLERPVSPHTINNPRPQAFGPGEAPRVPCRNG